MCLNVLKFEAEMSKNWRKRTTQLLLEMKKMESSYVQFSLDVVSN